MRTRNKKSAIIISILLLAIIAFAIYIFVSSRGPQENKYINTNSSATSTKNLNFDPLNFTYDVEGETIKLVNGVSAVDIVPGSAEKLETTVFDKPAIGDLNGDVKNDSAILLVQDSGGTGLFYYLVALYNDAGVIKNTNSIFIGDRIEPVSVEIKDHKVALSYVDRNEGDPMTAEPTVNKTRYFEIKAGVLSEVK